MYKEYYKLDKNPFQMTPDPAMFFASKGHKRALSYLQYGLSQGEGFIVVTGDIGTGKTTIVKSLMNGLDPQTYIIKQLVTTHLEEQDLIEMICESFDLISTGLTKAALLNQFKAFLNSAHKLKRRVVLIVDEVQNLPPRTVEELRMLSNFQIDNKPLIQSFLVGQKEFINTLQDESMEQLRQRVIASCHLGPLKREETAEYINYRLQLAGWNEGELFEEQALGLIHDLTEGVPRRINVFCDRIMLFGYLEEIRFFKQKHIRMVADELSHEITSPIKIKKTEEDSSISADDSSKSVEDNKRPVEDSYKPSSKVKKIAVPEPVQSDKKTVNDKVRKISSRQTGSATVKTNHDFVDINDTIKNFEDKVQDEINAYKKNNGN